MRGDHNAPPPGGGDWKRRTQQEVGWGERTYREPQRCHVGVHEESVHPNLRGFSQTITMMFFLGVRQPYLPGRPAPASLCGCSRTIDFFIMLVAVSFIFAVLSTTCVT
jgi:hypothetical protein